MDKVNICIGDFIQDKPTSKFIEKSAAPHASTLIEGVSMQGLAGGADGRGTLLELLSQRTQLQSPIVHVYQVHAEPGSVRAWVLHKRQTDRLAFTNGMFRIVLYDVRPDSKSYGQLNVFELGSSLKVLLSIPPFVVHGVQNYGSTSASFVNMPTAVYNSHDPDKFRVPVDHPGIPYRFPAS